MKDPIARRSWVCPHCKAEVPRFSDTDLLTVSSCRACDYEITLEMKNVEGGHPFEVGCSRQLYWSETPVDFESNPDHPDMLSPLYLVACSKV